MIVILDNGHMNTMTYCNSSSPLSFRLNVGNTRKFVHTLRQLWRVDRSGPVVWIKLTLPLCLIFAHDFAIGPCV
jgi:hypothetical protein